MNQFRPPTEDMQFILQQVLRAPERWQALPVHAEVDADLMRQVLEEAGKFVGDDIAPLDRKGGEIGAQFKAGVVTTPPGFRDAHQAFWPPCA